MLLNKSDRPRGFLVGSDDFRLSLRLIRRITRLITPYWRRCKAWPAWIALLLIFSLGILLSVVIIEAGAQLKIATDAMLAHEAEAFHSALIFFLALYIAQNLLPQVRSALSAWVHALWSRWLCCHVMGQYLASRAYYDISLQSDLDNPDQRIAENIAPFVSCVLQLIVWIVGVGAKLSAIFIVLAKMDVRFLIILPAIAGCQIFASYITVSPLVRRQIATQVAEGSLRSKLIGIRDHAEVVALYRAESIEYKNICQLTGEATRRQFIYERFVAILDMTVQSGFHVLWLVLPYLILGEVVVKGELSYGTLVQATAMTLVMQNVIQTLALIVSQTGSLAMHVARIAPLQERMDALNTPSRIIHSKAKNKLVLSGISVHTPDGTRKLVENLDLTLSGADRLLIVGPTGIGKSSLLRAMAGLWQQGEGQLATPDQARMLFVPQKPYFTTGNLRSQLLYPHISGISDQVLKDVLNAVCLTHLLDTRGGLDAQLVWEQALSLGEQQRIAFARVLLFRPDFLFLDEATSSVDSETERHLYGLLRELGCAMVSVAHRTTIAHHHNRVLELAPSGQWRLLSVKQFCSLEPQAEKWRELDGAD